MNKFLPNFSLPSNYSKNFTQFRRKRKTERRTQSIRHCKVVNNVCIFVLLKERLKTGINF